MDNFLTLFDLVGELARRRFRAAERFYSTIGLNHTEARLLVLLQQENGVCAQDTLSNFLHIDRSNAGRGLKRLEQGGYVERQKGGADKRTNLVQMTDVGRKAVAEIMELREKMSQTFFGDLKSDEAATAITLLRKALAHQE